MADLLSVDDALARVLAEAVALPAEAVALKAARGRYLSEDLHAALDLPPFAGSAMDGFAVRAADTPGTLRVAGESAAGRPFGGTVAPGEAVTISTGAVLPDGADTVVMLERAELDGDGATVTIAYQASAGDCVRPAGSDLRRGQRALEAGTRIGAIQVGAAAALGLARLPCRAQPRVAVLATGDELRPPGEPLPPGAIYNSNGPMLEALLAEAGALTGDPRSVADSLAAHRQALTAALDDDVVITCGGVSVGPHDLVRDVQRALGVHERFWGVALKPGKPLSFGVRERPGRSGPALAFGLPGNPISALVCFELFVRPALEALQGASQPHPRFAPGLLAAAVARHPERDQMIRVRRDSSDRLEPLRGQQSHQITLSAGAHGLARIPAGHGELAAGAKVNYLPLGASRE
ncbi:MAG: molybdopterin molybdotransferase MoeA [Solirubrobacteraceae bacterium]